MRKATLSIILISAIAFSSCTTVKVIPEEMKPLYMRLFSYDVFVRDNAVKQFAALSPEEKKEQFLKIAHMFREVKDPDTQVRMLNALKSLKAGAYAIGPLIEAVKHNDDIVSLTGILSFIGETEKPGEEYLRVFMEFLKDDKWKVRKLSLAALGRMSAAAETAVPEMIDTLKKFGSDPEKLNDVFDSLAMINPEVAVNAVIIEITSKNSKLRQNAVEKLLELQAHLGKKVKVKKDIMPVLLRVLYGDDRSVSKFVEEALKGIKDPAVKKELENYLKLGKRALSGIMKFAGKNMKDVFKSQERNVYQKMVDFYNKAGREDAMKKVREELEKLK